MVEENYESACRLCLNSNSKNINVFENNSYAEIITTISTSLSIQITQNDDFPKFLCTVCIEKVVSWDSFKKLCTESQEQLYQWRERKLQKQREEEEANAILPISRLETSIHIKEEFIEDDFDDSFEYTYETFTPEFNIKFESRSDAESYQHLEKSISPKSKKPVSSNVSSERIPFNYKLVVEMYKDNICKFCSKQFNRNSNLVQHLRLFHMTIPMFTCFCCGKSCKTKLEVQTHRSICKRKSLENSKHSNEIQLNDPLNISEKQVDSTAADYKFSCSLCGKLFKTIEEWTSHRATHVLKINDATSNFDAFSDEKINSDPINTEMVVEQSFSEVLNGVKIENVRSESAVTEQVLDIPEKVSNLTEPNLKPVKKSSRSKRKFNSRPKFSYKTNDYTRNYHCECGKKFITVQGFASHRKYHMRRGEFFSLKSTNKKNKDDVLESHKKPEVVDDKFKCNGCDKVFSLASKFRFHKKRCPNLKQQLPNKTEEVSEIKEDKPKLEEDDINAETEIEQLNVTDKRDHTRCSFCKRKYDNKHRCYKHENNCLQRPTDLRKFIKIHPGAVKCGGCGKCYISKSNYMKHRSRCPNAVLIEAEFQDENPSSSTNSLLCFLCKRPFLSAGALTEHKKRCYFQRTSSCIECKKVFDSFINFRIHYGQNHDRKSLRHAKRLKQMQTKQQNNLNIPGPINNGVTNTWSCKKCRKVFQTLKGYKYHMKTHVTHTCPNCNKFFYHSKHLTKHLEVCQKIEPENHTFNSTLQDPLDTTTTSPSSSKQIVGIAAPCAVCKMSFATISELREHILVKHKPAFIQERKKKTYFCQFCKMAFDRHSDLKQHFNEYHAGNIQSEYPSPPVLKPEELQDENNQICSLCQLSFETQDELFEHVHSLHNMEM
ncbi:zinc finger protein 271-like [Chrysoperla carnea]|uniref:zinc finger protein 271-like n=1 Tax=Chrysoperla carnea TaxID=189513 RepID=UPI001D078B9F|nr:zinc finger protein 271-like [Chrysoperla carnea]